MTKLKSGYFQIQTIALGVCLLFPCITFGQVESDGFYNSAYTEISDMLDGKRELSIKRAVFLAEWAYLDGKLDYDEYCREINKAVVFLEKFIIANGTEVYKTGKNLALIEYFFRPYSGNGYKPFVYDHNDIASEEDFTQQFVTKVIQTHNGQCRSLPYYYKILAEAIGAEAYIAYAPLHTFIRYPDDDNLFPEDWVNVELTTHQLTPEFHYIEGFEINQKALENKVYIHPLTDRETVASQLSDLAFGYSVKYGVYDEFTLQCVRKSLEYYPQKPNSLIIQGKSLKALLMRYLASNEYRADSYVLMLEQEIEKTYERLVSVGWEQIDDGYRERLDKRNKEARRIIEETGEIQL